ncbi:MAG: hypothetical protein U0264_16015 [Candidatus Kapaibacterium sp.]
MGRWKYKIYYYDRKTTDLYFPIIPIELPLSIWEEIPFELENFTSNPSKEELVTFLTEFAVQKLGVRRERSWSENIILFQDDNETKIEILEVSEIGSPHYCVIFKIDVNFAERKHYEFIIELGNFLHAYIFDFNQIFPPELKLLINQIKKRHASKFMIGGSKVLEKIEEIERSVSC